VIATAGEVVYADLAPGLLAWVAISALAGLAALVRIRPRLRGTTLVAAWWWSCGSLFCLCAVECWLAFQATTAWHSHLRYAATVTTFWPLIALLGARRPQDRAWQLIVISLWVIVLLPAGEAILYTPEAPFELTGAWQVFVLGLALVGLANALPTRRWRSAVALFVGQMLLLAPNLSWEQALLAGSKFEPTAVGMGLVVAALVLDALLRPRRRPAHALDRVWLDYRDAFGLLWSLRVAERFNAASRQLHWGIRLRWRGLDVEEGSNCVEIPPATLAAARQNLEMLLRRFVSSEWFSTRWNDRLD
jgi:hypothetical protein